MYRIITLWILLLILSVDLWGNNVRITKDAYINSHKIEGNVATIEMAVEWDNSWRDDYNWDAVYIFLKWKRKGDTDWQHVYLKDTEHMVGDDFSYWMGKSTTTADRCEGIFVYRNKNGRGISNVTDIQLKWLISQNSLTTADFEEGKVVYMAMCMEMVYIPKGPFVLGDGVHKQLVDGVKVSSNRLKSEYRSILPEWDLIKDDGSVLFSASGRDVTPPDQYRNYPPEKVANRVSDPRNGSYQNAWWPPVTPSYNLTVDFQTPKKIKWFGISATWGGGAPSSWSLYGMSTDQEEGELLYSGNASDWYLNIYWSYPISKALKIENPKAYRYYQIRTTERSMINNLAMTDRDLDSLSDNAYVVDRQTPLFINPETGLSSGTGLAENKWGATTLNAYYPTGFDGFYVMKYPVTQEQYVYFLNKLGDKQKINRTIGEMLLDLEKRDYVYGVDHKNPSQRNSIVIGEKDEIGRIFATDLNPTNDISQEDDGQTVACNFLSPADMLAYADWTGLRPLSELEYEKMARRPWPNKVHQWDWAGGTIDELKPPQLSNQIIDAGKNTERLTAVNVNAGGKEEGPVRSGAFAKGKDNSADAGASFWGVMDLSGNLSEIYYNVEPIGRSFDFRRESHGDGMIAANSETNAGDGNVSPSYWPQNVAAFAVRGGNFLSEEKQDLAVSERKYPTYFTSLNQKDSTVTFRLGHSCSNLVTEQCTTYLKLQNGRVTTGDNVAVDSLCSGQTYTITGSPMLLSSVTSNNVPTDVLKEYEGRCTYLWFIREHEQDNTHWNLIRDEHGKDLTISNLKNYADGFRNVYIKRVAITPTFSSETFYARLCVINDNFDISRLKDTVAMSNQTKGFYIETRSSTTFTWKWNAAETDAVPLQKTVNVTYDYFFPEREDFQINEKPLEKQNHIVICEMKILNKCKKQVDLEVYVAERLNVGVASSDITLKGKGDLSTQCGVLMQDSRDKNVYGTVQIGDQCWMAENLRFNWDGSLPQKSDPKGEKLGRLYNWTPELVINVCPSGWRLPANVDYETLKSYLNQDNKNEVGKKLKAANFWNVSNRNYIGTNSSGFGAVGSGYNGNDSYYRQETQFITSNDAYYYQLLSGNNDFTGAHAGARSYYFAIRCIKR